MKVFKKNQRWKFEIDEIGETVKIVRGHIGRCKTFRIPNEVTISGVKYRVKSVDLYAFNSSRTLKRLIIPDGVQFVDECNFNGCKNLKFVYIGESVEYVLPYSFPINKHQVKVIINKANQYLVCHNGIICARDGVAICSLIAPRSLVIPEGVKVIGSLTFNGNNRLEEVKFPSSLKMIDDNGLSQCNNLKQVILPEGFESINVQGLMDNANLEMLDLPSTTIALGYEALYGCKNLRMLIIRAKHLLEPKLKPNSRFEFSEKCELYVPGNLLDAYKEHPVWGNFKSVKPL